MEVEVAIPVVVIVGEMEVVDAVVEEEAAMAEVEAVEVAAAMVVVVNGDKEWRKGMEVGIG